MASLLFFVREKYILLYDRKTIKLKMKFKLITFKLSKFKE